MTFFFAERSSLHMRGRRSSLPATARRADVVIGAGGGRAIDTSKMIADALGKKLLLAPTCAAQCASFAQLAGVYKTDGARDGVMFIKIPILGTYVDMGVMRAAPKRLLASGIADAFTKLVEPYGAVLFGGEATVRWETTIALAGRSTRILLDRSAAALDGDERALNDVLYAAICLTGLLSSLGGDRPGPSLAHGINDAVHDLYTDLPRRCLHGENVSVGVLLSAHAYDIPGLPAGMLRDFFKNTLKTPTSWAELGFGTSERDFERVLELLMRNFPPRALSHRDAVAGALRSVWN